MTTVPQSNPSVNEALKCAVRDSGAQQALAGAKLGSVARQASPGFSPKTLGFRSLKDYIQECVPELAIVGYSGVDPVYGLKGQSEEVPQPPKPAPATAEKTSFWRVWASPECGRLLVVDRNTGEVGVSTERSSIPDGSVSITPASAGFHVETAQQFLRMRPGIPASLRSELEALVADAKDGWWRSWATLLKDQGGSIYRDWSLHRVEMLAAKFEETLRDQGLAGDAAVRASSQIQPFPIKSRRKPSSFESKRSNFPRLRDIVVSIIPTLSEDEIRELRLPLGKVFDAIADASRNQ
ncbi:hypothetical protein [Haloferula sp. A504]|uniref:hypothetical protein n=1 Tax=Haloferula sp. A504 TaxID=3373601 RepID=UPI0031C0130D|nr:hypothetical protein [Verrucomicrobiaceae bacterium E54]